jgi:hypothetical protein
MNVVKRSVINHPYIAIAIIVIILILGFTLYTFPLYQSERYLSKISPEDKQKPEIQKIAFDIENSNRLTIAQIIAGFVLLVGLYFTYQNVNVAQRNLRVTEEGKITDRFSKAVEMLGSEKLEVRLGGIYALERIARDSQKDHWTVMEVLTSYVRENSHIKFDGQKESMVREDIQAVMSVISRRKWWKEETQALNLRKVDLSFCNLKEAILENVILDEANLFGANLNKVNLKGATLCEANISKSDLSGANLKSSYLFKSDLSKTNLKNAVLNDADLRYANLNRAKLYNAEFKNADVRGVSYEESMGLTLEQILSTTEFGYNSLPDEIKEQFVKLQKSQNIEAKNELGTE